MGLDLCSPLLGLACATSTHGLTDACYPPRALWPYAAAACLPPWAVTPAFAVASVAHFARDVGAYGSVVLHATLVVLARDHRVLASTLGCLYYVAVHVPNHLQRQWRRTPLARAALVGAMALLPWTHGVRAVTVPHWAQRVVVGHAVVERDDRGRSHFHANVKFSG